MSAGINDIPSDVLVYIFSFLRPKNLFQIEIVNKKWQICVRKSMNKRITQFHIIDLAEEWFSIFPKFERAISVRTLKSVSKFDNFIIFFNLMLKIYKFADYNLSVLFNY